MKSLESYINEAGRNDKALPHFNISDTAGLKAVVEVVKEFKLPIIIGVSEGERDFLGIKAVAAMVKSLKDDGFPIFLNADHTHTLMGVKKAAEAGFDSVLFDGSQLLFADNVRQTQEAIKIAKTANPNILVEGELGYIGTSSRILKEIPAGAAITEKSMTSYAQAKDFVGETGVDLFAPAIGNIHGMLANAKNPALDIERLKAIKKAVRVPLVLHGGSGIDDQDFRDSIRAGVSIIHISTEIRLAWRKGLEKGLKDWPDEVAPYRVLRSAVDSMKEIMIKRLKLFSI